MYDTSIFPFLGSLTETTSTALPCALVKQSDQDWSIFTDASFESQLGPGGLGGVLVDCLGNCRAWFSLKVEPSDCKLLGADSKETNIRPGIASMLPGNGCVGRCFGLSVPCTLWRQ